MHTQIPHMISCGHTCISAANLTKSLAALRSLLMHKAPQACMCPSAKARASCTQPQCSVTPEPPWPQLCTSRVSRPAMDWTSDSMRTPLLRAGRSPACMSGHRSRMRVCNKHL
jgi:hypothetical protein